MKYTVYDYEANIYFSRSSSVEVYKEFSTQNDEDFSTFLTWFTLEESS